MQIQIQAYLLLAASTLPSTIADTSPFHAPQTRDVDSLFSFGFTPKLAQLVKRQNLCPPGFNSCAILGSPEACCQPEAVCSRDAASHIACCPSGAACTGTLSGTGTATQTTPGPTPTSSGFMFPQPGTTAPTPTGSTVPNAPYPFVYIPTTFQGSAECVRSYSGCQSQFSACTASLGGAYGVTINAGNGAGTTVQGAAPTGDGQAICSSLLTRACYGLQEGYCTAFGNGGGLPNGSPQRNSALYEIIVGLSIALAGMVA